MKVFPLSDVAAWGKEKNASHPLRKALVQDSESALASGMAWTNLEDQQTMVNIYLKPLLSGKGPKISKLMCENLLAGTGI